MYDGVKPDIDQIIILSAVIDVIAASRSELAERIKFQVPRWLRGIILLTRICQFFFK